MVKLLSGVISILLIVILVAFMKLSSSEATIEALRSNVTTLEQDKEMQDSTIKSLTNASISNEGLLTKYSDLSSDLGVIADKLREELTQLRSTEAFDALQKPFDAGILTDSRLRDTLRRISNNSTEEVDDDD